MTFLLKTFPAVVPCALLLFLACAVAGLAPDAGAQVPFHDAQGNADAARKSRDLMQAGDQKRLRKDYEGARKCYEDAAAAFQSYNNQLFGGWCRTMMDFCTAMPAVANLSKLKSGTYEGSFRGYIADVTVAVELKDGKISQFKVVSQKESRPGKALDLVPRQIISKQSPSVDAVTGATVTSYALMNATQKALEKAVPDSAGKKGEK